MQFPPSDGSTCIASLRLRRDRAKGSPLVGWAEPPLAQTSIPMAPPIAFSAPSASLATSSTPPSPQEGQGAAPSWWRSWWLFRHHLAAPIMCSTWPSYSNGTFQQKHSYATGSHHSFPWHFLSHVHGHSSSAPASNLGSFPIRSTTCEYTYKDLCFLCILLGIILFIRLLERLRHPTHSCQFSAHPIHLGHSCNFSAHPVHPRASCLIALSSVHLAFGTLYYASYRLPTSSYKL